MRVFFFFFFRTETVWNVWLWTSDIRGAGTDANVFMTLYGDKGKTDEVPLGNATDNFEQGQLDKFKVSSDHSLSSVVQGAFYIHGSLKRFAFLLCSLFSFLAVLNHMYSLIIAVYSFFSFLR